MCDDGGSCKADAVQVHLEDGRSVLGNVVGAHAPVEQQKSQHDRREGVADLAGAVALDEEQHHQYAAGDGDDGTCSSSARPELCRGVSQRLPQGHFEAAGPMSVQRAPATLDCSACLKCFIPWLMPLAASLRPSTAETTETAGVSTPSPMTAPTPSTSGKATRRPEDAVCRAVPCLSGWAEASRAVGRTPAQTVPHAPP